MTRRLGRLVATACAGVLAAGGFFARAEAQGDDLRDQRRIIHHFDFDERDEGNLEDIPKFWTSLRLPGFPRFTEGRFDFKVGHTAPPSFYLSCKGRNVAFHYGGPDAMVRARSVYEITGFMLPDRLKNARTCLTAHFIDRAGNPIPGTLVRSRFVGASEGNGDWVAVTLHLPAAGPEAESIGVGAWVLQEPLWATQVPSSWHIPRRDVHARAWFDDITIRAIPRAEISTTQPGQVMAPDAPQALLVTLSDFNDRTLTGRVVIAAADGVLVEEMAVSVVVDQNVEPTRIPIDHLAPGFYRATAYVLADDKRLVSRTLSFVRVGQRFQPPGVSARAFGVVIDPSSRAAPRTESDLLRGLTLRSAKVPVWSGLAEPPLTPAEQRARDRELTELAADGFVLTGAFLGPPASVIRRAGRDAPELIDLLTDTPEVWETHLASAVAPYATLLRWWQIGAEGSRSALRSADFGSALVNMREAMSRFVSTPLFTLPSSADDETVRDHLAAEQVSIKLSPQTRPATLARQLEQYGKLGYQRVSAYVEPLSAQTYRRLPRLIDYARRIILARHGGADTVFVPQPWRIFQDAEQRLAEPAEEYLIVRTIADVLGDAKPGQRINVAPGVRCLAFHRGRTTTLAIWDQSAPVGGNEYTLQLGSASRWVDMWGRSHPLARGSDGRHKLLLTSAPIFVPGVQRWLLDFRTSIALDPAHVESGTELMHHNLLVAYRGDRSISGTIELDVPESWEMNPWSFRINLTPQRSATFPIEAHYPHNEPAGTRTILAKVQLELPRYYMEVPIDIDVGLKDLRVSGMAIIERGDLVLRHIITNESSAPLNFRSSAEVPGRERQYRPVYGLGFGETQTVEYRFAGGAALTGETFRLNLRETRDGGRSHTIQRQIP